MARISASIPEDLKDELYQAANDENQAISHIIVEALRAHFGKVSPVPNRSAGGDDLQRTLSTLVTEVRELKEQLGSRTPPRGTRFF